MKEPSGNIITARKFAGQRAERGSALALTLLVILTVTVLLFANIVIQQNYIRLSRQLAFKMVADNAARAGISLALYHLDSDPGWKGGYKEEALPQVAGASYTISFDRSQNVIPFSTNNSGTQGAVEGYGGRSVPAGHVHIIALGKFGGQTKQVDAMVHTAGVNPFAGGPLFTDLGGINGQRLRRTDSWDSSAGSYAATRKNSGGTIGSNTTSRNAISLGTGTRIYGDIEIGPGGIPRRVVSGRASQYGEIVVNTKAMDFPEIIVPPVEPTYPSRVIGSGARVTLSPGTYGDLVIRSGGTAVLGGGSYVFSSIRAQSTGFSSLPRIEASGAAEPVIIYMAGNINMAGGEILNTHVNAGGTPVPSFLQIYGSPSTTMIEMRAGTARSSGSSGTAMVLYAPQAALYLNGNSLTTDYYGALCGRQVRTPRAMPFYYYSVHYDSALKTFQLPEGITSGAAKKLHVEAMW